MVVISDPLILRISLWWLLDLFVNGVGLVGMVKVYKGYVARPYCMVSYSHDYREETVSTLYLVWQLER